jgi:hypothetical protein
LGVEAAGLSVACFHAQQAAEKAIKSVLTLHGIEFRRTHEGASKSLALLVFRVPDFIFWLKEGGLSMSYMLFFATPSSRPPTHWVFRGAHDLLALAELLPKSDFPITDDWLIRLTPYAVEFRYDDEPIHLISGREAQEVVAKLLGWAEQSIA